VFLSEIHIHILLSNTVRSNRAIYTIPEISNDPEETGHSLLAVNIHFA